MSSGGARAEAVEGPLNAPAVGMPGGGAPQPAPGPGPRRFGRLRPGDRVAVVSPSGPAEPARLEAGCAVLRDLGLDVVVGANALGSVDMGSLESDPGPGTDQDEWHRLAGTDADRAADLQDAWCDPQVRAVICSRGGYGATRMLDHLDWPALLAATEEAAASPAGPKILHGSSDVTALHVTFGSRLGVTTSFGPMPAGVVADLGPAVRGGGDGDQDMTLDGLRSVLFAAGPETGADEDIRGGPVSGTHALRPGRARGALTGGTLTLLTALLGTPYAPPPAAGRVVFLEDVTEAPYRIDRMLTQLLQAGWFDGAAGVVLGSWAGCGDPAELDAVFTGRLAPLGVPILAGVPAGHGPCQLTLELGAPVLLDADALTLRAPGGTR